MSAPKGNSPSPRRRHHRWRTIAIVLGVIVVIGAVARGLMPWAVRHYVNRTIDRSPLYDGEVGDVRIHLWRGAYSLRDVRLNKTTGNVPVPFFAARRLDFAIQWKALFHGKVVGRVLMDEPELNFVDAAAAEEDQTGAGAPWLQMVRDLFPFRINQALVRNGSIHFRAYRTAKPVDVYLSEVQAVIEDLANIHDDTAPLIATVQASGLAMDQAKFDFRMTLDPFSYRPTFHLATRLMGLDVTKINDLAMDYGNFDFQRGWFDLVVEADSKEGRLSGYAKPLFRDVKVFSLKEDLRSNPFQALWQALVGATTVVFKNQPRDQFGTLIPFSGDTSGTRPDILATIGNVLRNAFVRAYLPRLERGAEAASIVEFSTPEFTEVLVAEDPLP
ncbi:MAG TPA: DUF748 domain-containing protein [Verrucomicrobiae bacterium]|nr:DUF748 domain-containing protein [Verrucomicrobiae bacterium]